MIARTLFISLLYLLGIVSAFSQNLVKNPGFEDSKACPEDYGTFHDDVTSWHKPTQGSTDYFNICGTKMSTGLNFIGNQETFDGNAYAGFYAYGPKDYREYISGELAEKLVKGKKYTFSFRVSLADKSQYAVDELGILFSQKLLDVKTKRNLSFAWMRKTDLKNYVGIRNKRYLTDKGGWMEISGEYIADGTEKYMTIGNFKSNSETRRFEVASNLKKASYYFIDMVSVAEKQDPFRLDETYVLENLFFKVNGYEILGNGKKELQKLADHLKDNPALNISIYGHTDNLGSETHNKELSQKRAQEVAIFLLKNGLAPSRIAWKGFGDMIPLAVNETEEGRKQNRRVEFVVSEKGREFYASSTFEEDQ